MPTHRHYHSRSQYQCRFTFQIDGALTHNPESPAAYVACVAVRSYLLTDIILVTNAIQISRMMFNLRGLVVDDPYGTKDINLLTLEFNRRDNDDDL